MYKTQSRPPRQGSYLPPLSLRWYEIDPFRLSRNQERTETRLATTGTFGQIGRRGGQRSPTNRRGKVCRKPMSRRLTSAYSACGTKQQGEGPRERLKKSTRRDSRAKALPRPCIDERPKNDRQCHYMACLRRLVSPVAEQIFERM